MFPILRRLPAAAAAARETCSDLLATAGITQSSRTVRRYTIQVMNTSDDDVLGTETERIAPAYLL